MNKDYLITKSNTLINTRYDLKLEEQKIILTLASMVQPTDEDFKPYVMSVKEFAALTGVEAGNRYSTLRKLTRDLMTKVFEIEKEDGGYLQVAWLSSCEYKPKTGTIELEFSAKLKPYLLQLKSKFTSYYLSNVLQMKSKYSIRLYEILKSQQFKRKTTIEIADLKFMLKCESYKQWTHIRTRVIEPAITEINQLTDLFVDYEPIKTGRAITALEFTIESSSKVDAEMWATEKDLDGSEYLQKRFL